MESETYDQEYFEGDKSRYGGSGGYTIERVDSFIESLTSSIIEHFNVKKVLDLGCAKGFLVGRFREKNVEAYGLDLSHYAISTSEDWLRPFLAVVDVESEVFPYDDMAFDFVTALELLEHLETFENVLRESRRVLVPGGYLYVTTPRFALLEFEEIDKTHINVRSLSQWLELFRRYGFTPQRCPRDMPPKYAVSEAVVRSVSHGAFIARSYLKKYGTLTREPNSGLPPSSNGKSIAERLKWAGKEVMRVAFAGSYRILLRKK